MVKRLKSRDKKILPRVLGHYTIFFEDIGSQFIVRQGNIDFLILIEEGMIGLQFSSFLPTKMRGNAIHVNKKKKLKKK